MVNIKDKKLKILLIVILVIVLAALSSSQNNISKQKQGNIVTNKENEVETVSYLDNYIEKYNSLANCQIINLSVFDLHDKSSQHYRTEFRLKAFENATARTGTLDSNIIDIIDYSSFSLTNSYNIRIYANISNKDIVKEFIRISSQIFDSTITENDLEEVYNNNNINDYRFTLGENNHIHGYIQGTEIMLDYNN